MGLTQIQFAERLGVSSITVHRWESGESRPRRLALARLREVEDELAAQEAARASPGPWTSVGTPPLDFAGSPEAVSAVAEALRLAHGHQFNPAFASETARIDPLPHQRIAVYERMLGQDPLRFLLADDAGAGKTIMTGLWVREMLLRGRIRRVLIVPPAGLVGNWERELRTLFRLQFRILSGADARAANPFRGSASDLVIVSVDTLVGERMFGALRDPGVPPYDVAVFDEAHKLSATFESGRIRKTNRYELAEALAGCAAPNSRFDGLGWEKERSAAVQDVSKPERARLAGLPDWPGFDLLTTDPDGEVRSIEVKGRAGRGAIQMEANEWKQACHLGERYWLYVVFDCATPAPRLVRVRDPFGKLLANHHSSAAYMISAGSLLKAAEQT